MGSAVESFRIPGVERPELVDHPAIVTARGCRRLRRLARCDVPKAFRLIDTLVHQQIDVVEEELAALVRSDGPQRLPGHERRGLLENPGIAKRGASHEDARDTAIAQP